MGGEFADIDIEAMLAARFNIYWFLSILVPASIMLTATYRENISRLTCGILLSLISTFLFCNLAVDKKWDTRFEIAKTEAELEYASGDGGNRVLTFILIAPIESVFYTTVWGLVGWFFWPRYRESRRERRNHYKGTLPL